jgi:hypothetical protein
LQRLHMAFQEPQADNKFERRYEMMRGFLSTHRTFVAFVAVLFLMMASHILLSALINAMPMTENLLAMTRTGAGLPIDFAPEVWLATVALVLGTLIIVISISSQSTPKLIDLYMQDWLSLAYLWFMLLAMVQNFYLQIFLVNAPTDDLTTRTTVFMNTYVYLPLTLLAAIPYIFYILNNTKTSRVIQLIHAGNLGRISMLVDRMTHTALETPKIAQTYQLALFESFNQYDDLMHHSPFKEPKALAMTRMGQALCHYIKIKPEINPAFFEITPAALEDISFLTIKDQKTQIERSRSFYELKAFRILNNHYAKMIERDEFDLASLCASQLVDVSRAAGRTKLEEGLLEILIIQFNTLMRFAINQGLKSGETRHIYNLLYFYRQFILEVANAGHVSIVEDGCDYLKMYSSEIYRLSRDLPAFQFLVDVCVAEMRVVLQHLAESKWPEKDQREVLDMMLTMDDAPDDQKILPGAAPTRSVGVRVIQVGLALFYEHRGQEGLVEAIIDDFIDPNTRTDIRDVASLMWTIVNRLQTEPETFWEVTDRGNQNIYYCSYIDCIPDLMDRFQTRLSQMYSRDDIQMFGKVINGSETKLEDEAPKHTPPIANAGMNYRPSRAS